ncbi:uncharacterized protein FRV6_10669 [Fusarium oxysporum]|uniref:Uncharacterized protein n=1 Tax=Fusarium oxysporum TaxID=5507 RepID=A0A2H3TCY7_FUSOX|nr:uncharacterized protein FRV6_10669 [Fusarium oxysporum]
MAGIVALTETSSHLEMVLWAEEEDLRRTAHSPIFRNNLTKYLGVHSKVRGPGLFFHEPGFWLDEINNNNTKILRSKIANSNSGSGEIIVGSDIQKEDSILQGSLKSAVIYGKYVRDPIHENIDAQCAHLAPLAALCFNLMSANVSRGNRKVKKEVKSSTTYREHLRDNKAGKVLALTCRHYRKVEYILEIKLRGPMLRLTNDINDPKLQSDIIEDQHRPQPLKHWSDQYKKLQDWKARVIGAHLLAAQATPDCIYTGNPKLAQTLEEDVDYEIGH